MIHNKLKTIDLAYIGLSTALLAICAWISVPIGAVPITLQTLGVCVIAGLFGTKKSTISTIAYLILGAIGVPVFSQFKGGIGFLFGATGGYVLGFVLTTIIIGTAIKKWGNTPLICAVSMVVGVLTCYIFGSVWFACFYSSEATFGVIITTCVLPFIVPDIIKIALSVLLVKKLKKFIK